MRRGSKQNREPPWSAGADWPKWEAAQEFPLLCVGGLFGVCGRMRPWGFGGLGGTPLGSDREERKEKLPDWAIGICWPNLAGHRVHRGGCCRGMDCFGAGTANRRIKVRRDQPMMIDGVVVGALVVLQPGPCRSPVCVLDRWRITSGAVWTGHVGVSGRRRRPRRSLRSRRRWGGPIAAWSRRRARECSRMRALKSNRRR